MYTYNKMNSNVKGAVIAVSSIFAFMLITTLLMRNSSSGYMRKKNVRKY